MARRHAVGASDARHARRRAARNQMGWSTSRSTTAFARSSRSIPGAARPVRMWSRLGNEKTAQFPDLVAALTRYAKKLKGPVVLDGEIVALDDKGEPAGFQRLQNRIHLTESNSRSAAGRVAFIAFDILRDRDEDLRPLPLTERRARLERVFRNPGSPILRTSDVVAGDARALYQHALDHGWEGLIAKDARSRVSHRQTHARLAEAEDRSGAGVRRRRLDRLAHHRPAVWRAAARLLRRRRLDVRGPHRQRLQSCASSSA